MALDALPPVCPAGRLEPTYQPTYLIHTKQDSLSYDAYKSACDASVRQGLLIGGWKLAKSQDFVTTLPSW
jgi:hypothetical protein